MLLLRGSGSATPQMPLDWRSDDDRTRFLRMADEPVLMLRAFGAGVKRLARPVVARPGGGDLPPTGRAPPVVGWKALPLGPPRYRREGCRCLCLREGPRSGRRRRGQRVRVVAMVPGGGGGALAGLAARLPAGRRRSQGGACGGRWCLGAGCLGGRQTAPAHLQTEALPAGGPAGAGVGCGQGRISPCAAGASGRGCTPGGY